MKLAFLIINGPDLSWVSGYLQNIRMPSPLSIPVSQPDRPAVVGGGACVCMCALACAVSLAPSVCDSMSASKCSHPGGGCEGMLSHGWQRAVSQPSSSVVTSLEEREQEPPHLATCVCPHDWKQSVK